LDQHILHLNRQEAVSSSDGGVGKISCAECKVGSAYNHTENSPCFVSELLNMILSFTLERVGTLLTSVSNARLGFGKL